MASEILTRPLVLVVDDEALIRWALAQGLADAGYPVGTAASAAEARAWLQQHEQDPVLVLLDLRLPDVSDLSFLQEIRRFRPEAPVLILTAHGSSVEAEQAEKLGAAKFLNKPFDVVEIVRLVGEAWESRAA